MGGTEANWGGGGDRIITLCQRRTFRGCGSVISWVVDEDEYVVHCLSFLLISKAYLPTFHKTLE